MPVYCFFFHSLFTVLGLYQWVKCVCFSTVRKFGTGTFRFLTPVSLHGKVGKTQRRFCLGSKPHSTGECVCGHDTTQHIVPTRLQYFIRFIYLFFALPTNKFHLFSKAPQKTIMINPGRFFWTICLE